MENMSDLFVSANGRLNDRERAMMSDILRKLVISMEMAVRRDLSDRLAANDAAPRDLVNQLANDEIEVARPILLRSKVLEELDLIEVIKHRGQEHQIVVAQREGLSAAVADVLIDFGDEDVISALIENHEAEISARALDYLVSESRRIDRFQEPLLQREDLPTRLAQRMFWWVSAALRKHILSEFDVDEGMLDDELEAATQSIVDEATSPRMTEAEQLVAELEARRELNERFLVQSLRNNQVSVFIAGLARIAGIDRFIARRIVFDMGGESLAVACRAAGFDRTSFGAIFMLTRAGAQPGGRGADPATLQAILQFFDKLTVQRAHSALRYWMRDEGYLAAIERLEAMA
ncbi:DUF2336 domain-containing protein [Oceanibacterium hippocampi]|uniref:DUF2336 domain-containing protein n=1 Tax=Oceanibacterium hippocampi TaxID=745714 RepID=A0A1Y5U2P6_9PROT|nr:DUF2336 domain-containing protein [Oceanibacterium hippocampi]SLN77162.1 hypothetical protein OCH7691_04312 [Oceanibacterium hippocampi]